MNVRRKLFRAALLAALVALPCVAGRAAQLDIKKLAPTDAHTVVYAKENPERAYQAEYVKDAWKTFQDEKICERVMDIVSSRAPKEKLDELKDSWKQIQTALEPINLEALANGKEFMMFNTMEGVFGHTLIAFRLTDKDAEAYRQGTGNLFELIQKWSKDKVAAGTSDEFGAKVTRLDLKLPEKVTYLPAVAAVGDLFIVSTSDALLKKCLAQLNDSSAKSKFDDPRLKEALSKLPPFEDSMSFFDAAQLFKNLRGIGDFIRKEKPGDADGERGAKLLEQAIKEVDVIDYEVAVEYTEKGQNRTAALGKMSDGAKDTLLGRALSHGTPFENWQKWVPSDATAYSLSTGIDLHEIYVGVLEFLRDEVPESHEALGQWEAMQEKVKVNLDEDILQSFSGEVVSVTLPGGDSVTALKCSNPSKIKQLLERAIAGLKQIPEVQAQGLDLVDCDDAALEGFKEFRLMALAAMPNKPVIGFNDDWMILGSSPAAAKALLAVRRGEAKSIEGAESLKRFNLKTDGPVNNVSYTDIGQGIREFASAINQAAGMAPLMMGAAMQGAKPEDLKTVNQVIALLPSISKVIAKFDFYEQSLSIVRKGPMDGTYLRESVTLIRQPDSSK